MICCSKLVTYKYRMFVKMPFTIQWPALCKTFNSPGIRFGNIHCTNPAATPSLNPGWGRRQLQIALQKQVPRQGWRMRSRYVASLTVLEGQSRYWLTCAILIVWLSLSLRNHLRSQRTSFVTYRTIVTVIKASICVENMPLNKLLSKASKYGSFHGWVSFPNSF